MPSEPQEPVIVWAYCSACPWSRVRTGTEFNRYAVRQLAQSDGNTHERRHADADVDHEKRVKEIDVELFDYERGKYDGYTMPRGPLGHQPRDAERAGHGPLPSIGFCPRCGTNARETTGVRGVFDCPRCTYAWYDERVGQPDYGIEDFTVKA